VQVEVEVEVKVENGVSRSEMDSSSRQGLSDSHVLIHLEMENG